MEQTVAGNPAEACGAMPAEPRTVLARSNITACQRCRRRKQKCDHKLPKCRSCQKAGVECVSIDAVTQQHIPRSYVHSLEERVAFLENTLLNHGIQHYDQSSEMSGVAIVSVGLRMPSGPMASSSATVCSHCAAVVDRARDVVDQGVAGRLGLEARLGPDGLCSTFTAALLRHLYVTEAMRDGQPSLVAEEEGYGLMPVQQLDTSPAELPDPNVAEHLIQVFFELSNFSVPILHEPSFRARVAALRTADQDDPRAAFFAFIVFGIALLTLQKHDAVKVSTSLCERYYAAALCSLDAAGLPSDDLEGVQALLLVALYAYLHPRAFQPWRTVGMAMHLAVSLGLHRDQPAPTGRSDHSTPTDALTLDTRRRVFWVAYAMDRTVSSVLGRPFAISDGAISCPLPSPVEDAYITAEGIPDDAPIGKKAFGLHYLRYRQLQSEIQVVLYEKRPFGVPDLLPLPLDYAAWQRHMHGRLEQWLAEQPAAGTTARSLVAPAEALDLAFHQAVLLLFRPSPAIPHPPPSALLLLADAATATIQLYRRLHRENKLRLFWQAVHNLFAAGTALIHCYTHAVAVRARISLRALEGSVHTCSAVLWAMVERFPSAKGTRDAFDVMATAALDSLSADIPSGASDGSGASMVGESPGMHSLPGRMQPMLVAEQGFSQATDLAAWPGPMDDIGGSGPIVSEMSPSLFQGSLGMSTWL